MRANPVETPSDAGGPLYHYAREVRRYDVLSRERELELAERYAATRDPDAGRELVTANLRLVVKIARRYAGRSAQAFRDLVQEGNLGLIEAVDKFDASRGVRFASYASWWIRAYILKSVVSNARLVKIGTTAAQRRMFYGWRAAEWQLEASGEDSTIEALSKRLGLSERDVVEMRGLLSNTGETSLDELSSLDDGVVPGVETDDPSETYARREVHELVRRKVERFAEQLTGRSLDVLRERVLVDDPPSLQTFADRYGVTVSRVQQIESKVKSRLQRYLKREFCADDAFV